MSPNKKGFKDQAALKTEQENNKINNFSDFGKKNTQTLLFLLATHRNLTF